MSAPLRGRGGGTATRNTTPTSRGRGANRGNATVAGRGRGRGRGGSATAAIPANNTGLLQKLRSGTGLSSTENATNNGSRGRNTAARGHANTSTRARGNVSKTFGRAQSPRPTQPLLTSSPAPTASHRDFMTHMNEQFQSLRPKRDAERRQAIHDGFLADPEKKVNLKDAITPVGTCTDMCPEFERVERIVQNMIDRAEKVANESTGRDMPSEDRMVKRFKRSAAGDDEQLPSDIRTPETLRRTLDYLLDKVLGNADRLAPVHEFIWNRTRCIRNDFSIQQVTKREHVEIAVDCLERIARFHILSLHQLSNPDNLQEGEEFAAFQEREQLNNTLLSLEHFYNDNRARMSFPNEPEFRAYRVLFNIQASTPDLEAEMQQWPIETMVHPKVQTARKLYAAAGNTIMDQGPLRPTTPFSIAQSNPGKFFATVASRAVSYLTACMAEMSFNIVRFVALDALWRSGKSAPQGQQARNQDWTLTELQHYLAFDDEDQTLEFCLEFDLAFKNSDNGEQCLDFTAVSTNALDKSKMSSQQIFSFEYVEEKRCKRSLLAVINSIPVAEAIRSGQVISSDPDEEGDRQHDDQADAQSLFIPDTSTGSAQNGFQTFGANLNPSAAVFTPSSSTEQSITTGFGGNDLSGIFGTASNSQPGRSPFGSTQLSATPFQNGLISNAQADTGNAGFQLVGTTKQQPRDVGSAFKPQISSTNWFGTNNNQSSAATPVAPPPSSNVPTSTQPKPPIFGQTPSQPVNASPTANTAVGTGLAQYLQRQDVAGTESNQDTPVDRSHFQAASQPPFNMFGQAQQKQPLPMTSPLEKAAPSATPGNGFVFAQPKIGGTKPSPQPLTTPQPDNTELKQKPLFSFPPANQFSPADTAFKAPAPKPAAIPDALSVFAQASKPRVDQKPLFSFAKPSATPAPKASKQQSTESASAIDQSTTPLGSPKRPQPGNHLFPSVASSEGILKDSSNSVVNGSTSASGSELFPHPSQQTQKLENEPPTMSLPREPAKPTFTEKDRARLVKNTSRLILTQSQGLIEYFVSHHVSNLLQTLVKKHLQDQQNEVMTYVRTRHLSRKFYAIWRENVQRKTLSRRAKQRRKLLAAAMQAEQERKQRDEDELEAILAATEETKRIQEEQRMSKNQADTARFGPSEGEQQHARARASPVVGQKRKTTSANVSPHAPSNTLRQSTISHKRSRTLATMSEPSTSMRLSTLGGGFNTSFSGLNSSRLGQSSMSRSDTSSDLRRSMSHKVDTTKTDYFKLKAMGIDPNTPIIPDTARSLELRKKRTMDAKEALLARSKMRPSLLAGSVSSRHSSPMPPASPKAISAAGSPSPLRHIQRSTTTTTPSAPPEEDAFLRQLREARQSLAQDADWFKNQTDVLEKEIQEREDLRRSHNSPRSSNVGNTDMSINGLTRVNGYEYYRTDVKPGKTLSRTEARIRKTGGHGFATRPPGRDYVPVAMSRQSASRYNQEMGVDASATEEKRLRGGHGASDNNATHVDAQAYEVTSPASKRMKGNAIIGRGPTAATTGTASLNAFAALQDDDIEDEDDDGEEEELEEEEDEVDDDEESHHYNHNGVDGDTEDNDEEDLVEEDEEEGSDPDNHHPPSIHHYATFANINIPNEERVYDEEDEHSEGEEDTEEEEDDDDDGTPGTYPQYSRAQSGSSSTGVQSGPGASADDAVVLSD